MFSANQSTSEKREAQMKIQIVGRRPLNLFERTDDGRVKLTGWVNISRQDVSDSQRVQISVTDAMGRFVQN